MPPFLLAHTHAHTPGLGVTLWSPGCLDAHPPGPRVLWARSAPFLGTRDRGVAPLSGARTPNSPLPRVRRFWVPPATGLPRRQTPPAASGGSLPREGLGLGPRSGDRAAPEALRSGVGDFEISLPRGCGAVPPVARKAARATSRSGALPGPRLGRLVETPAQAPLPRGGQPPALPTLVPGLPGSGNSAGAAGGPWPAVSGDAAALLRLWSG